MCFLIKDFVYVTSILCFVVEHYAELIKCHASVV